MGSEHLFDPLWTGPKNKNWQTKMRGMIFQGLEYDQCLPIGLFHADFLKYVR